jgi:hypothetical protein
MSIGLCLMFVYLYRANSAAHGTQNIVDINGIDNGLGPPQNSLIRALHDRMESSA